MSAAGASSSAAPTGSASSSSSTTSSSMPSRSSRDSSAGSASSPSSSTRSWPSSASCAVGCLAAARQPTAEELEEGAERVDGDGELALPADEVLDDLDDVELANGDDSPKAEVEEEIGPVADAPDLADLEIED